jgi:hypothetical protein
MVGQQHLRTIITAASSCSLPRYLYILPKLHYSKIAGRHGLLKTTGKQINTSVTVYYQIKHVKHDL